MNNPKEAKCLGKHSFTSAGLAREVAGRARKGQKPDVYRCKECGAFHIGNRPRTAHRNLKRRRLLEEAEE